VRGSVTVESVQIKWLVDESPDLSWLDQTDEEMGEGFEKHAQERKESYGHVWEMLGCVAEAVVIYGSELRRVERLSSGGLWGIESDSGKNYLREIEDEQLEELANHLGAFGISTTAAELRELAQ
jgi:hypothetical protein